MAILYYGAATIIRKFGDSKNVINRKLKSTKPTHFNSFKTFYVISKCLSVKWQNYAPSFPMKRFKIKLQVTPSTRNQITADFCDKTERKRFKNTAKKTIKNKNKMLLSLKLLKSSNHTLLN